MSPNRRYRWKGLGLGEGMEEINDYYCRKCGAKNSGVLKYIERSYAQESLIFNGDSFEGGEDYETVDYMDNEPDGCECNECGTDVEGDPKELFTTDPDTIEQVKGRQLQLRIMPDSMMKNELFHKWELLQDPIRSKEKSHVKTRKKV